MKNVGKKRFCICVINHTDSAKKWQLGGEYDFAYISKIGQDGVCLGDIAPPVVIAGSVDCDDDPQTVLELLGI